MYQCYVIGTWPPGHLTTWTPGHLARVSRPTWRQALCWCCSSPASEGSVARALSRSDQSYILYRTQTQIQISRFTWSRLPNSVAAFASMLPPAATSLVMLIIRQISLMKLICIYVSCIWWWCLNWMMMNLSLYPVSIWLRSSTYLSSVATNSFSTFSLLKDKLKMWKKRNAEIHMSRGLC